jgi:heme oxygenase (mycobilin-producing)
MSVVKINAIEVPTGAGAELERRFAARAGAVENAPGFEGFQLLRPVEGEERYFVVTWWASEDAFEDWKKSQDFSDGHAQARQSAGPPVATGSTILSFEVVERVDPPSA